LEISEQIAAYFEVPSSLAEAFNEAFSEEVLTPGDYHTECSKNKSKISFVLEGYLRVFRQSKDKEVSQWISSPGEFCCDLNAVFFQQVTRWNIQALSNCRVLSISSSAYQDFKLQYPEWEAYEKAFFAKCFVAIEERVFSLLSLGAEERYNYLQNERQDLVQNVPQQYLASMLGMSAETYSRMRKKSLS
jgi:CRP-like cAMP-binding protein